MHRTMDRKWTLCFLINSVKMLKRHSRCHLQHFCTSRQHQLYVYHSKQTFLKISKCRNTISLAKIFLHSFGILALRKLFIIFLSSSCRHLITLILCVSINLLLSRLNNPNNLILSLETTSLFIILPLLDSLGNKFLMKGCSA